MWQSYSTGTIHWTQKYGAVALWYDLQREYNDLGGSNGWLGFPTKREYDWNGGKRTDFEGGYIYWDGQKAKAYHLGEMPQPSSTNINGHTISGDFYSAWQQYQGLLGNPVDDYNPNTLEQHFERGYLSWNGNKINLYTTGNGNPIRSTDFTGTVGPSNGVNLRYSPKFDDRSPNNEPQGKPLEFDGWTYGDVVNDLWTGQPDARWYRVKGTDYWVPSAYIAGNAPGSSPMPNSQASSSSSQPISIPHQTSDPNGFHSTIDFSLSIGVTPGIKLRTDTYLNAPYQGVSSATQFQFDGWKYGEAVQDRTIANGSMDSVWLHVKGTNYWIPSAFMIVYPPGYQPPVSSGGSGGPTSAKGDLIRTGSRPEIGVQISTTDDVNYTGLVSTKIWFEKRNWGKKHIVTINWGAWQWRAEVTAPIDGGGIKLQYTKNNKDSVPRTVTVSAVPDGQDGATYITNQTIIGNGGQTGSKGDLIGDPPISRTFNIDYDHPPLDPSFINITSNWTKGNSSSPPNVSHVFVGTVKDELSIRNNGGANVRDVPSTNNNQPISKKQPGESLYFSEWTENEGKRWFRMVDNKQWIAAENINLIGELPKNLKIEYSSQSSAINNTPKTGNSFIDSIAGDASKSQLETGIPASVTIAQAILESGWGKSELSSKYYNYFGIKGEGPAGFVELPTQEEIDGTFYTINARFRRYHNPQESFTDHGRFFLDNSLYAEAIKYKSDPERFAQEIAKAGYATDSSYSTQLIGLINQYNLKQFDK